MSVVVPTRDRPSHLTRCLLALYGQDRAVAGLEIIVVNDGPAGQSEQVVDRVTRSAMEGEDIEPADLPSLRVVSSGRADGDPGGVNRSRNRGLEAASGDPIAFLDDDIEVRPDWAARLVQTVSEHPEAGCIGGPYVLHGEKIPRFRCGRDHLEHLSYRPELGGPGIDEVLSPIAVEEVWGANLAVRRWAIERIGPFDVSLSGAGDEIEWQVRLRRAGGVILCDPGLQARHWRHENELTFKDLLQAKFRRERTRPRYWHGLPSGSPRLFSQALRSQVLALRCLLHAICRQCSGGLIDASGYLGLSLGCIQTLFESPRHEREEDPA